MPPRTQGIVGVFHGGQHRHAGGQQGKFVSVAAVQALVKARMFSQRHLGWGRVVRVAPGITAGHLHGDRGQVPQTSF